MLEHIFVIITPAIIAMLIFWLIYRIKLRIRFMIKEEIYNDFPSIKDTIASFELRIDYLKTQVEDLEKKIKELK